ncbi:MAG: bestrophin family protein [Planctomycetota bacterium]
MTTTSPRPRVARSLSFITQLTGLSVLVGAYAAIPAYLKSRNLLESFADVPADIHAALTLVLGWLLVFRTNTSYSRWWEARTLWGALVNTSRNLSAKFVALVDGPQEDLRKIKRILILFPQVLRDHLRDGASLDDEELVADAGHTPQHAPSFLAKSLFRTLRTWKKNSVIDGFQMTVMEEDVRKLLEIVGACERIRNTRLARSYRTFARQCVILYLTTLPWGIVHDFSWWTVPLTAIISYFMLGMEIAAEHTEEPFGCDEDDLDLDALCRVIEASVIEIFQNE